MKGQEKIIHANRNSKKAGVAIHKPKKKTKFKTVCIKRQRQALNNGIGINTRRGYYTY